MKEGKWGGGTILTSSLASLILELCRKNLEARMDFLSGLNTTSPYKGVSLISTRNWGQIKQVSLGVKNIFFFNR